MARPLQTTVRLDPLNRRKVERLALRDGISFDASIDRLLRRAAVPPKSASERRPYRLQPRTIGFGFEIADARKRATRMSDDRLTDRLID